MPRRDGPRKKWAGGRAPAPGVRRAHPARAARDAAARRRVRAGWLYGAALLAGVLGLILALAAAQGPTFDRLGPYLDTLTPTQRVLLGLAVGCALASPLAVLLVRRVPQVARMWIVGLEAVRSSTC